MQAVQRARSVEQRSVASCAGPPDAGAATSVSQGTSRAMRNRDSSSVVLIDRQVWIPAGSSVWIPDGNENNRRNSQEGRLQQISASSIVASRVAQAKGITNTGTQE